MSRNISYGRGGAARPPPKDFITPTIKQEVYTTGRGGSGNMVHNDPERPEIARESQDVESPPCAHSRSPTTQAEGRYSYSWANRCAIAGGAANAYIPTPEEEEREKKIQEQEAELIRVRTQSKDRVKEIEQERQELRKESSSST
ncbi:hypothetical protein N7472_006761 [Penicillium cf. griseofulvum]|uniref:Uncharacterized protein n=1 Tax=Penicillium cf. griseofulvum TaxID=2972120 RepID=A0A9W9JG33_9EURO|nr:hypothetical protein N7472_006761 [Penicillium cf. griseofulvum]